MSSKNGIVLVIFLFSIITFIVSIMSQGIQRTNARSEQLVDSNNNNLMINMQGPDNWNSGIVSQTVTLGKIIWLSSQFFIHSSKAISAIIIQ